MAGGVAVPSQTRVFFLWQFLKYVVWRCHAENIFCHQTSLVKRLQTQVFLVECGTWWCSMWCFLGAAPNILRLLHNDKYIAYHFWPENHVLVLVLAYDQVKAIHLNVKIETPLLIPGDKIIAPLLIPAQEVKLVRPLNTFFFWSNFQPCGTLWP